MDTPAKKILILAANPKQTSRLRLDEEVRDIKEGLRLSQQRDKFILQQEWAVRPRDVRRAVLDFRPNIIHFSGHGSGTTGLSFEDEIGKEKLVTSEALAGLFGQFAKQVECVVLNACYSEEQALAIAQHIDYVIGMNAAISDKAALEFAVGFYDALVAYDPRYDTYSRIEFAFNIACNAIQFAGVSGDSIPIMKKKPDLGKVEEQVIVNPVNESPAAVSQNQMSERIIAQAQNLRYKRPIIVVGILSVVIALSFLVKPHDAPVTSQPCPVASEDYKVKIDKNTESLRSNPNNADAYRLRAWAYYNLCKYQEAIADSTKSIQINPKNAEVYNTRGLSYHEQVKYELAIADFNKAIELKYAPLKIPFYSRGQSHERLGDYNAAIEDYNKAIGLDPDYADAYYRRGYTRSKQGDKLAIKDYQKAAELYQKQGKTKDYQEALDKIKQLQQ